MTNLSRDSFRYFFKLKDWTPTNSNLVQAFRCIQKEERERIKKFHFKDDFKAALVGRLLIRKIINQRFDLSNKAIELKREEKGRPYLVIEESTDDQIFNQGSDRSTTFDFNVSHHGDYCVAVGEDVQPIGKNAGRIGVDIMKIEKRYGHRTIDEYFRLMNEKFTENEWSFINAKRSDEDERIRRFMRMWTLKESFTKADGRGLTIDLRRIDFSCKTDQLSKERVTNDTELRFDKKLLTDWTFLEYLLDDNYCVAIAINKSPNECTDHKLLNEIKFDQLVEHLEPLDVNKDEKVDIDGIWNAFSVKETKSV